MQNAANSDWVLDVNEENFQAEVIERSKETPVVIDFWAPWCAPCRQLGPLLESLAKEKKGAFVLAKVNTDESPQLAEYFQIDGIPAVFAVKDAQIANQFTGVLPMAALEEFLGTVIPTEAEKKIEEAKTLEGQSPEKAAAIYREQLKENADNEPARLGLARLLVVNRGFAEAMELLAPLGDSGEFGIEAERLRTTIKLLEQAPKPAELGALQARLKAEPNNARLRYEIGSALASSGKYPEALAMLLSAAEGDVKLARGEVKELMVQVFHIIGARSDLADEYRQKLQDLLY